MNFDAFDRCGLPREWVVEKDHSPFSDLQQGFVHFDKKEHPKYQIKLSAFALLCLFQCKLTHTHSLTHSLTHPFTGDFVLAPDFTTLPLRYSPGVVAEVILRPQKSSKYVVHTPFG